ncbi:hypothetical protein PAECIP111893_03258 [Paenibacillus plantiphilus]|uniref:Uncharacterized protein n=1 Tax=Paenibacillus plantiphilus TaxID=2905650 RepID=A0ABM9CEN1_9BACL|nr:hypothetical protein [Paenibacillus plantiphilus]CAH1210733.1 hypothetical protein PAECIP111893_03258 [Paenibacillus plantiphilus]
MQLEKTDKERGSERLYKVFLGISISSAVAFVLVIAGYLIYKFV